MGVGVGVRKGGFGYFFFTRTLRVFGVGGKEREGKGRKMGRNE